ncbi:hypothetical protein [Lacticaseibacillus nasuensis]|uniref:Uncharacterized protein n=1 Tax=Lacticaseibacillus nasuensis JCM 17158 TaxID=1291734 RepID=A0A0R1JGV1_9LACO|nr:hypothetical protein [Lacticaseibacillus nasuensis]KRK70187.1 hypothetical protein FD02_GL000643 [Lacticaseibacillus nasuensis JCM 17158]MCX2455684.1 hypothetical protein [Lacticaseibacillus nasuensis]
MAADAATLEKADEALNTTGFITEKEIPELADRDFSRELSNALTKAREKKGEEGYIYTEPFDFSGGKITNIIWDMDKIGTREAAKETLAEDMDLAMPTETLSAVDQKTY